MSSIMHETRTQVVYVYSVYIYNTVYALTFTFSFSITMQEQVHAWYMYTIYTLILTQCHILNTLAQYCRDYWNHIMLIHMDTVFY